MDSTTTGKTSPKDAFQGSAGTTSDQDVLAELDRIISAVDEPNLNQEEKEKREDQLINLAEYEHLNVYPEIAEKLAVHTNPKVREALAGNPQLRLLLSVTQKLVKDPDIAVLKTLAENGQAFMGSPESAAELAKRKITSVNTKLAANGLALAKSELATLLLARSSDISVRLEVATNMVALMKWPSAVLVLAQDPDETIRNKITPELLKTSMLKIIEHGTQKQKENLAKSTFLKEYREEILALYKDENVRPYLKKEYIGIAFSHIADHGSEEEKAALAEYRDLRDHPRVTEKLSRDPSHGVRLELSNNKNALIASPQATLILLGAPEEDIREYTANHESIVRGLASSQQEAVLLSLVKCPFVIKKYPDLGERFLKSDMPHSVRLAIAGNVDYLIDIVKVRREEALASLKNDRNPEIQRAFRQSIALTAWVQAFSNDRALQTLGATLSTQAAHAALCNPTNPPNPTTQPP